MAKTLFVLLFLVTPLLAQTTPVRRAEPVTGPTTQATVAPSPAPTGTPPASEAYAEHLPPAKLGYNSIYVEGPYIAITFDDGPHGTLTPRLLDILAKRNIKATFFVLGQCVQEYPEILKRMADEGHEIANHSWSHPAFAKLSNEAVRSQINQCQQAITGVTGKPASLLRPPYGSITQTQRQWITRDLGLKIILWSVDPLDWKFRNAVRVEQSILSQTKNGAIILAHDIHPTTIDAMPGTLDALLGRGYKFVSVSDLLAMEKPRPAPTPKTTAARQTAAP